MNIPAIIDLEASGFGKGSYPIEVAYALLDGSDVKGYLIRPEADWQHWSDQAQDIHGISKQRLQDEGLPVYEVAQALNQGLKGRVVYSDAWGFDRSWLARLFDAAGVMQQFKLEALSHLLTQEQLENWHVIKDGLWQDLDLERHRAANDVIVLRETYQRVRANV